MGEEGKNLYISPQERVVNRCISALEEDREKHSFLPLEEEGKSLKCPLGRTEKKHSFLLLGEEGKNL